MRPQCRAIFASPLRNLDRGRLDDPASAATLIRRRRSSVAAAKGGYLPVGKPQLDVASIVKDREKVALDLLHRRAVAGPSILDDIASIHGSLHVQQARLAALRGQQADLSDRIRLSKSTSPGTSAQVTVLQEAAATLRGEIVPLQKEAEAEEQRLYALALALPNTSHAASPTGPYEASTVLAAFHADPSSQPSVVGQLPRPNPQRDHLDILTSLGWLSFEAGQRTTGSSFPVLKGAGAALELALSHYAIAKATAQGWHLVLGPDVVRVDVAERCGFAPRDGGEANQTYFVTSNQDAASAPAMCLAATAEIPLTGSLHSSVLPSPSHPRFPAVPIRHVSLGRAFRAEAGARGTESRGLYRVHQFSKVELMAVTEGSTEASGAMLDEMVGLQKEILTGLELPFRSAFVANHGRCFD